MTLREGVDFTDGTPFDSETASGVRMTNLNAHAGMPISHVRVRQAINLAIDPAPAAAHRGQRRAG